MQMKNLRNSDFSWPAFTAAAGRDNMMSPVKTQQTAHNYTKYKKRGRRQ